MTICRWIEFFEGDNERLSMTRLLCFMSFFPASYVVVLNVKSIGIGEILGWYLGAYVLGYVGGKASDTVSTIMAQKNGKVGE